MGKDLDIYTGPSTELEVAPEIIDAEIVEENTGPYVELSENNSGGHWWLDEDDWLALEKAGWVIGWAEKSVGVGASYMEPELGKDGKYRFYGDCRAKSAKRYGVSQGVAAAEFYDATGQHIAEEGCECCGPPHNLYTYDANGDMTWEG